MRQRFASILAVLAVVIPHALFCSEAADYGERYDFELRGEEQKCLDLLQEIIPGSRGRVLEVDLAIVKAARGMADDFVSQSQSSRARLTSEVVRKKLRQAGVADQRLYFNYTQYRPGTDFRPYIESVRDYAGDVPYTHVGAGVSEPGSAIPVLVVILTERMVEIDHFPRRTEAGGSEMLKVKTVGPGKGLKAEVLLTTPSGKVFGVQAQKQGDMFVSRIPFTYGAGTYTVEVIVSGRDRSSTAAIMDVSASGRGEAPAEGVFKVDFEDKTYYNPAEAEADLILMINQVRQRSGLSVLKPHPKLMEMAREHSNDMMKTGVVGHYSQEHGPVERRAAKAGIQSTEVLENVAANISVKAAVEDLLASPVHRNHIINPEFNKIGVGVAIDRKERQTVYYISQEFAFIP